MDANTSRVLSANERRLGQRCRGKRQRPSSAEYSERVNVTAARIEIDLTHRRFDAARAAIAELESFVSESGCVALDTPLADTVLADHPRLLGLLEVKFNAIYVGELLSIPIKRLREVKLLGDGRMGVLEDFIESLKFPT